MHCISRQHRKEAVNLGCVFIFAELCTLGAVACVMRKVLSRWEGCVWVEILKLILGGLHEKEAVKGGIWLLIQHLL